MQNVLGYMDVSRDISHRKQEQQALQESQKFVQKIIDTTPNLIYIYDHERGNLFINQMVAEMLGYSPEEYNSFSTDTIFHLIHPDDVEGFRLNRESLVKAADGTVIGSEFRIRHKNGQWRWLYSRESIFLRGADGLPAQVIGTSEDITERKQKDARILQANAQLLHAARLSAVGQLATGVAHQVSNPLTAILGETQLLLRDLKKGDPIREAIETIETAGWRAQWAVQILNTFSEPPSNTIGSVNLFETIRMAISLIGINLQSDGVSIQLVLDSEPPQVRGNPRQIEALWVNLLLFIHGIINMRACSLQIQSVDLDEDKIAIDAILEGIRVSEAQLNAVFDENLAVTNSSTISGMEYSICQEIVRQNQGTINVTSNHNYSTFRVILPKER
jgi:PAS domain S-box-containing protein